MMDFVTGATLAIAVLSLVLSVASLTWQAATFVLSGSRVRAELKHGARNASTVVTGAPGSQDFLSLAGQGLTDEVIGIEVRNVGRLAASIQSVSAALASGLKVTPVRELVGPTLPHTLEPQSAASWFLPAAPIRDVVAFSSKGRLKQPDPNKVWMEVTLGTGKVVRSKQSMWLGSRPQLDRLGRSADTDKIEKK
jgi:hypothetical protein